MRRAGREGPFAGPVGPCTRAAQTSWPSHKAKAVRVFSFVELCRASVRRRVVFPHSCCWLCGALTSTCSLHFSPNSNRWLINCFDEDTVARQSVILDTAAGAPSAGAVLPGSFKGCHRQDVLSRLQTLWGCVDTDTE